MSSPDYSQAVADILDGLGDTPTPDEVYHAVKNYSVDNVVAATASTAKAGGGGGSYTPPTSCEEWSGNAVSVVPDAVGGTGGWLTWTASAGPDSLLDNSTQEHPTIITAGVYMVSAVVHADSLFNRNYFVAGLHLDRTGFNASMYAQSSQSDTTVGTGLVSDVTLAFAWYVPAGGQIGVFVNHFSPDDSNVGAGISIPYAHIQRIS